MDKSVRLVLLTGLGADHRALEPMRAAFGNLHVPRWIRPEPRESLTHYAGRLAETVPPGEGPLLLGGLSLGGMLALEMAPYLKPRAVALIASCRDPRAVWRPLYRLARLARWIPLWCIRASRCVSPWYASWVHRCTREQIPVVLDMYRDADPWFMRWACGAIRGWQPTPQPDLPVWHIHGSDDWLIPAANVSPHAWVPHGGHLLSLTHPEMVNDFLRRIPERW